MKHSDVHFYFSVDELCWKETKQIRLHAGFPESYQLEILQNHQEVSWSGLWSTSADVLQDLPSWASYVLSDGGAEKRKRNKRWPLQSAAFSINSQRCRPETAIGSIRKSKTLPQALLLLLLPNPQTFKSFMKVPSVNVCGSCTRLNGRLIQVFCPQKAVFIQP